MAPPAGIPGLYRLAGQNLWFDPPVPELDPYRLETRPVQASQFPVNFMKMREQLPVVQTSGCLAEQLSPVSMWQDEHGFLLDIPAAGNFWTSADGGTVRQVYRTDNARAAFLAEAFLGPPLLLALALRSTWCLHASAIAYDQQVIAFLGESGAGKSTLAAYLANQPGVRRVCDDLLPVRLADGRLVALPHFPQLKIPTSQQPGLGLPEALPMSAIYALAETPDISIEEIGAGSSALLLAGQTVAARLFNRLLLSQHFTFCGQAAGGIRVRRLAYPRRYSELPQLWRILKDNLAALPGYRQAVHNLQA